VLVVAKFHTKKIPKSLKGYLIAYVEESLYQREICINGDPKGLRSLGEALIAIADLDQRELDDRECPPDDSFHQHYKIGIGLEVSLNAPLPLLTIGRVDEKKSGKIVNEYWPKGGGR
jgi:hypothetical protein